MQPLKLPDVGTGISASHMQRTLSATPSASLLSLLCNVKSTKEEVQAILKQQFNPETFKEPYVLIGDSQLKCEITSEIALKWLFYHLRTYGAFFPTVKFVNCCFSRECHNILVQSLGECEQLRSLTFEKCMIADQELAEILGILCLLTTNLKEIAIKQNSLPFKSGVIDSLEVLFQLESAIECVNLSHNRLKDAEVMTLAKALLENHRVHTLCLDNNPITFAAALHLAHWIKKQQFVRSCSLVHTSITLEERQKLDHATERLSSHFIFAHTLPLPAGKMPNMPFCSPASLFEDIIRKADRFTDEHLVLMKAIKEPLERSTLFKKWLQIGFDIFEFDPNDHALSFFKAIGLACGKPEWIEDNALFHMTMQHILMNLENFTGSIFADFPEIPEHVHLGTFFEEKVIKGRQWPEHTIKLAIQQVLKTHGINRPIYIFSPAIPPILTADNAILPPPEFRLEEKGMNSSDAITLFFDGNRQFAFLTKLGKQLSSE